MKQLPEMTITGVSFTTSNTQLIDTNFSDYQNNLQIFFQIQAGIQNKRSENFYIVYAEYEKDFYLDISTKHYNIYFGYYVGNKQLNFSNLMIPSQKYVVFEVNFVTEPTKQELGAAVGEKWQEIWKNTELFRKRAFIADFEVYYPKTSTQNSFVHIYIGVRD